MRETKNVIIKVAKNMAEAAIRKDANRTTCVLIYQPNVPKELDRYKKSKK